MKKILSILFFTLMFILTSCGGGGSSGTTSSNLINIGTLPNGSQVYITSNNLSLTSTEAQTATISLVGGASNESFNLNFNTKQSSSIQNNSENNYGISVLPNPCILGTSGSLFPNSCKITVSVSDVTPTGKYTIIPTAVSSAGEPSTELSPINISVTHQVTPSSDNLITSYSINGVPGLFTEDSSKLNFISVIMPFGTNVTSLVSVFTTTSGSTVRVGDIVQVSGVTQNNFTKPVNYTVTSADGSKKEYSVLVSLVGALDKLIFVTSESYDGNLMLAGHSNSSGFDGANNICNSEAATLNLTGKYTALLVDNYATKDGTQYYNVFGSTLAVANGPNLTFNLATMITTPLEAWILPIPGAHKDAWTGYPRDELHTNLNNCNNWQSNSPDTFEATGVYGSPNDMYSKNTYLHMGISFCNAPKHLYCVQQ